MRLVLGIESSCDETAAALLEAPLRVRSSVVSSQIAAHRPFGGVVPELAARAHVQALGPVLEAAMAEGGASWGELDAVAVTRGPGLSSSLLSGLAAARGLSRRLGIPLKPVHHMEGHLCSLFLARPDADPLQSCPALVLLVTGGHTALLRLEAPGHYHLLGRSIDDAAGEALDKGARLLGLPYPGGPEIEKLAKEASATSLRFPRGCPRSDEAKRRGGTCAFSFSGLKTALRTQLESSNEYAPAELAAAYQEAVMSSLVQRAEEGLASATDWKSLAVVGGVAKNLNLRNRLEELAERNGLPLLAVPLEYCTDNAAMIAAVPLLRDHARGDSAWDLDPNAQLEGLQLR